MLAKRFRDWRFRERVVDLVIDDGRVACPRYGEIDVETCFACDLVVDVGEGSPSIIRCTSWSSSAMTSIEAPIG